MKVRKKVLMCTHDYPPDNGGIAAFSRDLKILFLQMGYSVELFKQKNIINKTKFNYLISYINSFYSLLHNYTQNNYDFVICTRVLPFGFLNFLINPFTRTKLIIQVHGTEITGRYNKGLRKKFLNLIYNRADQVWANSRNTENRLRKFGVRENKLKLVYPFLTNDIGKHSTKPSFVEDKKIRIVSAGTLYPRKGIDIVMEALSRLMYLEWEYIILGQPPAGQVNVYPQLAQKLGIEKRIEFLGQVNREKVWDQMRDADIFVLPSREVPHDIESFGIVYIEAQYFGTPCIGTNTGGIPEAIGDGGLLIDNENVDQLEDNLKLLITDINKRNLYSKNSKKRITNSFTIDKRIIEIEKYLEITSSKNTKH